MGFGTGGVGKEETGEMVIYLGKNVEVKGNLSFEGSGRIDGKVEGKVSVRGVLILGDEARVSSEVEGDTVVVGGRVDGKIVGRQKVQLLKTAVVNADITAPSLSVEEGGRLNGSCRMSEAGSSAPSERQPAAMRMVKG